MYPVLGSDMMVPATTVPQFPVAVPKSMRLMFDLTPPEVAVQLAVVFTTVCRPYAVADVLTSVPPPDEVGEAVYKAM